MKYRLIPILLTLLAAWLVWAHTVPAQSATAPGEAHIFFSAGCADFWPYTEEELLPALQAEGLAATYEIHDYTGPEGRTQLLEFVDHLEMPRAIADALYAFVATPDGGNLVILGHVPPELITTMLQTPDLPPRLVIWQPKMHGRPTEYRLWTWSGEVTTFSIDTPFDQALTQARLAAGPEPAGSANVSALLPAVLRPACWTALILALLPSFCC